MPQLLYNDFEATTEGTKMANHEACHCGCGELADECGNGILDWLFGQEDE